MIEIDKEYNQAVKNKDTVTVSSLRNLKAAIQNAQIQKQSALTDDEFLSVISKKVKQHKDSIAGFRQGNREDLVKHEEEQMAVLAKFLPQQMSEAEVESIVKEAIAKLSAGPNDFGKVMKEVVAAVKGQADGSVVSKIVKQELAQ